MMGMRCHKAHLRVNFSGDAEPFKCKIDFKNDEADEQANGSD
jgi:hypothetical protein